MKALNWIAWISAGLGVLLMIFAVLSSFTASNILGAEHRVNYFQMASTLFLITIGVFVYQIKCQCKKE
jgi:hypothetical protein